jgi:hypothetical protein
VIEEKFVLYQNKQNNKLKVKVEKDTSRSLLMINDQYAKIREPHF